MIFLDSQAAIKVIDSTQILGQQIISKVVKKWDELWRLNVSVTVHWALLIRGIKGNDLADKAAKEATGWSLKSLV
ncbi:uncharacterized protein P174DRAFT_344431, partial [Aspergillus novofumigatus IBT 16806]